MHVRSFDPNLHLIPLDLDLVGFRSFIGAWLYRGPEAFFLVDPGPPAMVPHLIQALESLSVERLDFILLTHVHVDHAGGTGDLLQRFPGTPVVCHAGGIPHMADPAHLWQASLKTLGVLVQVPDSTPAGLTPGDRPNTTARRRRVPWVPAPGQVIPRSRPRPCGFVRSSSARWARCPRTGTIPASGRASCNTRNAARQR